MWGLAVGEGEEDFRVAERDAVMCGYFTHRAFVLPGDLHDSMRYRLEYRVGGGMARQAVLQVRLDGVGHGLPRTLMWGLDILILRESNFDPQTLETTKCTCASGPEEGQGMQRVKSADGTVLAYDRSGEGPPVILVDGALCRRGVGPSSPLAARLARDFRVYTFDRRGRGASGDSAPYRVEREVEDVEALIDLSGG